VDTTRASATCTNPQTVSTLARSVMVAAKGNGKLTNVTDGRHEFAARHTDNDDVCSSGSFVYSSSSTVTGATDGGTHDVLKARALQLWLPGVLTDLDIWNAMQASTPCRRQCRAWCGQGGGTATK
jgi:hypothetical protein